MNGAQLRIGTILVPVVVLVGCGGTGAGGGSPSPLASTASTEVQSPSPSPEFDFCADASAFGDLVRSVREGTETDEELIATIDALQVSVYALAETVTDGGNAVRDVGDALGRLEVAIDAAGPSYKFDPIVKLAAKTVSLTAFTAALELRCPPP